jgi:FixJ family two-component response regulator
MVPSRPQVGDPDPIVFIVDDDESSLRSAEELLVDGLQSIGHASGRRIQLVLLGAEGDIPAIARAMKTGAVEFVRKPLRADAMHDALAHALERSRRTREILGEMAETRRRLQTLTRREQDVLRLVVRGNMNKQVAAELGISEITVKMHRHNVMTKMQAASLADLVRMCERLEILEHVFADPDSPDHTKV